MVIHYYYMTMCEHAMRSPEPIECQHGSLTGTLASPPRGVVYPGYLIYDAEGWA